MTMKMLLLCKSPAKMCQICPHIHKYLIQRNFSNIKQHTCTTVNARVIKSSHFQTGLGCTYRMPSRMCSLNPANLEVNRNCDEDINRFGDNLSNYTFLQERSNQCSSIRNKHGTSNTFDSHQNAVIEITNLRTERNGEFQDSKYATDEQFKNCETASPNFQHFNDKCLSSIQLYSANLNNGHNKQEHTCTVASDRKIKCSSKFRSQSKDNILNFRGISTCLLALNLLQNRHKSLVKPICCMFHTSTRHSVLHTVDGAHDNIDIKLSPPWKVKFFGTDEIAVMNLKALYENMTTSGTLVESIDVVTVPQMHAVHRFAKSVNLPVQVWPIKIQPFKYDVGILVSFGHLIPDSIIHMFPYGILNMHPSLLPRWRGASPIIHTILNGDTTTGVSIMEIRPKHFDIGPLLLQRKVAVPSRCTSYELLDILGPFGSNMVLECLKDLPKLERFEHEQNTDGITYAHKLKHSDAYIDWERYTAIQIDCQYRAISELMPLKTLLFGETVKLKDVVDPDLLTDISGHSFKGFHGNLNTSMPGTVVYSTKHDCMLIKCKDGFIGFRNIIIKSKITAKDFYNGYIQKHNCTRFTSLSNNLNKFVKYERIPVGVKV